MFFLTVSKEYPDHIPTYSDKKTYLLECSKTIMSIDIKPLTHTYIKRVIVPFNAKVHCYNESGKNYYVTDKIILSNCKYDLFNPKTIKKFKLNLEFISKFYILLASSNKRIDVLEWLKNSGLYLEFDKWPINMASYRGNINVLEWWKNSKIPLLSHDALDWTVYGNHVDVLEWWKNSGLPLGYSEIAIEHASKKGYINILKWWKNSGLELKYSSDIFDTLMNGRVHVLEWWKNSGLELKYTSSALELALEYDHLDVLDWWKNSGLELKYTSVALKLALEHGHLDILERLQNS
jgi:hypothetical protein